MVACLKQLSKQCCLTYYHQHWLHCLGTITWSTHNNGCTIWDGCLFETISCMFIFAAWSTWSNHNNGCTDAKKPFTSKFSFQSPDWDNLTRFIHLFQSTLFNIHKCILTIEAISTLHIQSLKPRSSRRNIIFQFDAHCLICIFYKMYNSS